MSLDYLKPTSKQLVYELVGQTGVDTADWANVKGGKAAANPKYCYDWAFWDEAKQTVVLCLWFSQTMEANGVVYQELNSA